VKESAITSDGSTASELYKESYMTRYQRSMQIWSLLICAANDRRTFTYGDIADILGMGGAGVMAQFLGPIMWLCEDNEWPPLTVLVVNQESGLPGDGLTTIENVNRDREKVFNFDWFGLEPPTLQSFDSADRSKA
jgi:alkylated DNA nucleotide flippase Atl1